jgi:hypothetical protein
VPFAGAGAFLVLLALGLVGDVDQGRNAPLWVVLPVGVLFAIVGLLLVAHGASGVARRRRTEGFRRKFPGQPWAWDHRWTVGGSTDETGSEIARSLVTGSVVALFLVPFHWVGFVSPDGPVAFAVLSLLFDAVVALVLGRAAYLAIRRARFGWRTLRFARFPFLTGETLEASLDRRGALGDVRALTATLRCVQERYETRGVGRNRAQQVVCYELWSNTRTVEAAGQASFHFTFPIPPDAQGTALGERPARYWELDVTSGDVPGVDFAATFLVPVYASGGRLRFAAL